jgi:hypothetical protein
VGGGRRRPNGWAVYQRLYREGAKETHEENEPDEYEEVLDPKATLEYDRRTNSIASI